jgi:hypothetical protein
VAARRVLPISLPASDPASAAVQAWLDGLPAGADVSAEVRRLLADAIRLDARLVAIEAELRRIGAGGPVAPAAPAMSAAQHAALDAILDFGG